MAPSRVDRDTFLQNLHSSGLLTPGEVKSSRTQIPPEMKVKSLARHLVENGHLTKFQAELLLIGRSQGFFLGPYKILDQVGRGGMGRVYKALHQNMKRTVALKVLSPSLMQTAKAQKLFEREVQAAGQLNHPNIVTAYDANQFQGRHYLAMEYVDGPNLDQLVRGGGPLAADLACEIIRQAALGLQHAHDLGMLHRDIKPANLLVQNGKREATVKILDFGLARLHQPDAVAQGQGRNTILVKENTVMGTPDFLSPEQARDLHQIDIRSDLYSLGCTFYFLLAGKVPHAGGTSLEKLIRHSSDEPPALESLRPDLPSEVVAIVKKMMAKRPEDRYQTPHEVAEVVKPYAHPGNVIWDPATLKKTAKSTPVPVQNPPSHDDTMPADHLATPLSGDTTGTVSRRRSPWLFWTGIGLVVLGLACLATAYFFWEWFEAGSQPQ